MAESIRTTITGPVGNLQADVVPVSSDPTKSALVITNADGSSVGTTDSKYKIRDIDDYSQTTYTYIGKQSASGAYQIARLTNATSGFEYAYGTSDYSTARIGRATLYYGDSQ